MAATHASKGTKYVADLYEARANGNWAEVPELTRKVEKHAPERRCLILSAKVGARLSQSQNGYEAAEREYGTALSTALEQEKGRQDLLDGLITRATMLFGNGKHYEALVEIPETLHRSAFPKIANAEAVWTAVCVIQGTLIKGLAQEVLGMPAKAAETYRSIIGYVSHVVRLRAPQLELHRWTEELLSHICLFFSTDTPARPAQLGEAMAAFHLLSKFLDDQSWRPLGTRSSLTGHAPREVWGAFYVALSRIVKEDLVYHPSPVHRDHDTTEHRGLLEEEDFLASRVQQRADLRRVEANYESLLLKDTTFPRADERNEEIKSWIELVMGNWRVLCGPHWTDPELGAGGKAAVGRSTLDMLYRAATKTFHSTQILRHLFTMHAFLAEFDLAFKAFDTYTELISRGKARAEKSGEVDADLDDDDTALRLAAEAIRVACKYGADQGAEKALQISETLTTWLSKVSSNALINSNGDEAHNNSEHVDTYPTTRLSPETAAIAFRAIAIAQAQYSHYNYSPQVRKEMQISATQNFTRALEQGVPDAQCTETLYAYGLLMAARRDIPSAIKLAKRALANPEETQSLAAPDGVISEDEGADLDDDALSYTRQRKLLPVFHLLALLLCAREDFQLAAATCQAAFDQFGEAMDILLAQGAQPQSRRQSAIGRRRRPKPAITVTLANMMDSYEKQAILEIKMTQLSLTEVLEGPEAAVNATSGLFALYAALFGNINAEVSHLKPSKSAYILPPQTPKHSGSTVRNIMSRSKATKLAAEKEAGYTTSLPNTSAVFATRSGSNANADTSGRKVSHEKPKFSSEKTPSRNSSLRQKVGSLRGRKDGAQRSVEIIPEKEAVDFAPVGQIDDVVAPGTPKTASNGTGEPLSAGPDEQFFSEDMGLPALPPSATASATPQFVSSQARRLKMSILVQVWLFVATLYISAGVYDDANDAVEEANKLSQALELDVTSDGCTVKNFQTRGWASGLSVEELWANVHAQRGHLLKAQSLPHDALMHYEQALSHVPDHRDSIVELSSILLDYYCQIIPAEKPDPAAEIFTAPSSTTFGLSTTSTVPIVPSTALTNQSTLGALPQNTTLPIGAAGEPMSPLELYRIAARDRAYSLLSSLTRLGSGWDCPKAWLVLAKAFEESKQIEKAKEALWWTVELEESTPLRDWNVVNLGGFVL